MTAVMDRVKQDMLRFAAKTLERLTWVAEMSRDERIQVEAENHTRQINLVLNEMFQEMDQVLTHNEMVTRWFEVIF